MTKEEAEKNKKLQDKYEENIPYIVTIKDKYYDKLFDTIVCNKFCGYLVNSNDANFYFELNYNHMLVIVPHSYIETMAPANRYFKNYREEIKK